MDDIKINIGGGSFAVLTMVFIVLKLLGVIDWSWAWVLSPIWVPWATLCIMGISILYLYIFVFIISYVVTLFN